MKWLLLPIVLILVTVLRVVFFTQRKSRCPRCSRDLKGFQGVACPDCGKALRVACLDGSNPDDNKAAHADLVRDIAARMIPAFKAASYRTQINVVKRALAARKLSVREHLDCILCLALPGTAGFIAGGCLYSTFFPPQRPIPFIVIFFGCFFPGLFLGLFLGIRQEVKCYRPLLMDYLSTSCPTCGHDLTGTTGPCPECGTEVPTASMNPEPESLRLV